MPCKTLQMQPAALKSELSSSHNEQSTSCDMGWIRTDAIKRLKENLHCSSLQRERRHNLPINSQLGCQKPPVVTDRSWRIQAGTESGPDWSGKTEHLSRSLKGCCGGLAGAVVVILVFNTLNKGQDVCMHSTV